MQTSKHIKFVAMMFLCAIAVRHACATPVFVGSTSIRAYADITAIKDGDRTYEFLDVTSTLTMSQAAAVQKYGILGFSVATNDDIALLFSAFWFAYVSPPSGSFVLLNVTSTQAESFVSYLGTTENFRNNPGTLASFIDQNVGQSYICVSVALCTGPDYVPSSFVNNVDVSYGVPSSGVLLVRSFLGGADVVPEPASVFLIAIGIAAIAALRRRVR